MHRLGNICGYVWGKVDGCAPFNKIVDFFFLKCARPEGDLIHLSFKRISGGVKYAPATRIERKAGTTVTFASAATLSGQLSIKI
ncbi:hypothetical protein OAK83_02305, partial [bacterium]|nr:hypothetical protein [bacterium]